MDKDNSLAIEGTRFFGEMSASISHEIKNVLAIINENAGLLQDLVLMHSNQAKSLDPERLSRLARTIQRQVVRGDQIARNLNRFAHSADTSAETVDVVEMARFILRLGRRRLDIKGIEPVVESETETLTITTNRFFLENFFWCSLSRVLEECGLAQKITIGIDGTKEATKIRYQGLSMEAYRRIKESFSAEERSVADFLGIEIMVDDQKKQLSLQFQS